ncbi:putative serine protease 42 isoform X1 [Pan paniscus]|uniref:putative serine protease 42 isoform X1 n=1 Tax=Pan paniscus TaxID=9597 RepID=UPI0024374491|nr:putative serine protease 42 isoform X1 [Pan paniscus]
MSSGGGSRGLLAWLLLLQPWPGQNWAGMAAPRLPSPLLSEEGGENPEASPAPGPEAGPPLNLFTSFPVCGRTPLRIVGGVDAEEGRWPWQVSVRTKGRHICGGTLVTATWVLMAGHCISSRFHYSVKMGDRSVYNENTSVVVPVQRAFVHPKFSTVTTIRNDLALLQLQHPVNFTSNIQPICIPQENFQVEGEKLASEILQEVDQYIMCYEECNKIIQKALSSTKDVIIKGMVCGYKEQGKDSCQVNSWILSPFSDGRVWVICCFLYSHLVELKRFIEGNLPWLP